MRNIFAVYIEFKAAFTPVSFQLYSSFDFAHCFEFIAEHTQTKKRRLFCKQVGFRHRFYQYDERFAAELLARENVDTDALYKEPTTDDRARVDIHSKFRVARWTGIRRL